MATFLDVVASKGKGADSTYRPDAGAVCWVSGPNCDDASGNVFSEMTILWRDDTFVLSGKEGCWPVLNKWDHVLCRPISLPLLTYENKPLIQPIIDHLRAACGEGEKVIWRDAFRWKDDNGVLSNCYEMFDLLQVVEQAGLEIVHDFCHVAIVREATP